MRNVDLFYPNLNIIVEKAKDLPEKLVAAQGQLDLLVSQADEPGVVEQADQVGGSEAGPRKPALALYSCFSTEFLQTQLIAIV